jgi:cytochrome c oxidase subunit III
MADAHAKNHEYHLVDPSPRPIEAAVSALVTMGGAVWWFHGGLIWAMVIGLGMLGYTFFAWWRDVINEAEHKGDHTPVVQLGLRYGMALFIASEVMFFVAWFWAFFDASLFPKEAIGGVWPPTGVEPLDPWHLPFVNTLILLLSGTTVTWAHHALQEGDRQGLVQGLVLTILLGLSFTSIQAYEYAHAAFHFKDGIYSSTFYMATGFHGAHVIIGTIFLIVCLFRALAGHFKPEHHFGFEAAAWYWHFVDVVWVFLFFCIYIGVFELPPMAN